MAVSIASIIVVLHILRSHQLERAMPLPRHSWSCHHLRLLQNLVTGSTCPLESIACDFPINQLLILVFMENVTNQCLTFNVSKQIETVV